MLKIQLTIFILLGFCGINLKAQSVTQIVNSLLDTADYYLEDKKKLDSALLYALKAESFKDNKTLNYKSRERIEFTLYHTFENAHNKELAVKHLKKLIHLENTRGTADSLTLEQYNLGRLGTYFIDIEEYDSAKACFQQAIILGDKIGNATMKAGARNNLGFLYEKTGFKDKALIQYFSAIDTLSNRLNAGKDSAFLTSINGNIARIYIEQNRFHEAEKLLIQNYRYLKQLAKQRSGSGFFNMRFAKMHFGLIEVYGSLKLPDKMLPFLEDVGKYLTNPNYEWMAINKIKLANEWVRYYQLKGNNRLAEQKLDQLKLVTKNVIDEILQKSNSISSMVSKTKIAEINKELETNTLRLEKAELSAQNRRNLLIFLFLLSILIIISVYFYLKRKIILSRLKQQLEKREKENQQLKNQQLKQDLKHKEADFANFVMQNTMRENLALDMVDKLNSFVKNRTELSTDDIKKLIRELKPKKEMSKKMELYQEGVGKVNNSFFEKLDKDYPTLTKTEKEVCGLMRLNLSGKEIASMRNIDPLSVRKMRNRIRKKFMITPETDLYEFVQQL